MKKPVNVAVVGATGVVGTALLDILAKRQFPIGTLYPLASHRSAGSTISFKDQKIVVEDVAQFDFAKVDIAWFVTRRSVAADHVPLAAAKGAIVIDNSSQFRYENDVPLVVPEVNPQAAKQPPRNIIANPNCSTIQMVVALKPIYDAVGIERINVATYQAVSGNGRTGVDELSRQVDEIAHGKKPSLELYPTPIAFNVVPHIDVFQENGYTREEMKMLWETRKIFNDDNIKVNATTVRVPVMYGHSEAVHIETRDKITPQQAIELLRNAPGVKVFAGNDYPTAVTHGAGADPVFVGRIREDISHPRGLNLWVVADNVRKGAALNAVQIAELF